MDNIYSLSLFFISFSILLVFFIISNWTLSQTKNIKLKHLEEGLTNSPIFRFIKHLAKSREQHIYATYFYIILISFLLGSCLSKIIIHFDFLTKYFQDESILVFIVISLLYLGLLIFTIDLLKGIFSFNAEKTLVALSPLIYLFCKINSFFPRIIIKINNKILNHLGRGTKRAIGNLFSTKELGEIFEESNKNGLIEDEEKELLKGVINFSDTNVREIMTPRHEIAYVQYDDDIFEVAKIFAKEGFSRLLVCDKELDNVKGIVLAKDVLAYITKHNTDESKNKNLKDILRHAYLVRENKQVDELLQEFRQKGIHLAVVLDEHGGVEGLVTIEDLIEEIVGDIIDEHDLLDKTKDDELVKKNAETITVSGLLSVHDFNEDYAPPIIPDGEYETIAGFMIKFLSKVPQKGDNFDYDEYHFVIINIVENRIDKISISPVKPKESSLT